MSDLNKALFETVKQNMYNNEVAVSEILIEKLSFS